jgi:hypothetical protein
MPYLIDGHNLIGSLPDIDLNDPNDEALLVQKLTGFVARTRKKCVVVFDSGLPGGESRLSTHGVKVVFASHLSDADQVIIERIGKAANPTAWTVVSSDNRVLDAASRRKMNTLRAADFAELLRRPTPPGQPGPDIAADVHLSDDEVDDWLRMFNDNQTS